MRHKLDSVARGRPLREIEPDVHYDTRFSVLGLAPNAARLSVRFWYQDDIGAFARRIREHWQDLRLEPTPWRTVPSARRLLYETAVQRKAENIPPTLGGALMRAILTGTRYPQSLLAVIIMRMRADSAVTRLVTGVRAAIAKACIVRGERLLNPNTYKEDYLVSLDCNSESVAYNLGRLFAAYATTGGRCGSPTVRHNGPGPTAPFWVQRRRQPVVLLISRVGKDILRARVGCRGSLSRLIRRQFQELGWFIDR